MNGNEWPVGCIKPVSHAGSTLVATTWDKSVTYLTRNKHGSPHLFQTSQNKWKPAAKQTFSTSATTNFSWLDHRLIQMSIFVNSQGKFVFSIFHSDHELHSWFFAISRMLRLLTKWRTINDCTMYTHCLRCMAWIALTNKMADSASACVSMLKIRNRYSAKIDICMYNNLWLDA